MALGLHQLALSNELYERLGDDFSFIATEKITSGRFGVNYEEMADSSPYVIKAYSSEENKEKAKKILLQSDVIILGSSTDEYYDIAKANEKALLLIYSERVFKEGYIKRFIPKTRNSVRKRFFFEHPNVAVLSASAYLKKDLSFFKKDITVLKWGYFPQVHRFDIDIGKNTGKIKLLWAGRMIDWKRPLDALALAERLSDNNIDYEMAVVGDGVYYDRIEKTIKKKHLEKTVVLYKAMPTAELFEKMKSSDIFLFTSNFKEGWGAVLNEAMNAGCACVCSHAAGAVPYLVDDGNNGSIYKCGDINGMYDKVVSLINDRELLQTIRKNAYITATEVYNHTVAAQRLISLSENFVKNGKIVPFDFGILSESELLENDWF